MLLFYKLLDLVQWLYRVSLFNSSCTGLLPHRSMDDAVITLKSPMFSNIYLLAASDGYVMIDAGNHDQEAEILKQFKLLGIDSKQIKLIVVTHGHGDHYGALAHIKELSGADILSHREAEHYISAGTSRPPWPEPYGVHS